LKSYCANDFSLTVREFTINNNLLDILGQLIDEKPDVVGFLCCIWNIDLIKELINMVKAVRPSCIIVCGGPEVSYNTAEFMAECPNVSFVIRGEGEELFKNLLGYLHGKNALDERIARQDGDTIIEGSAVVARDLNLLPFPYEKEDLAAIKDKIIYYESSRGCPFSCQYCLSCATRGVRFLPLERVLAELSVFIKNDVRQVKFVDRTFNANKQHYLEIWRFLKEQDCRTNFHFEIAAELLDEEAMAVLAKMPKGRIQLEVGIQSTHEKTLLAVQRKNDWAKLKGVIPRLVAFGNIHVHVDLIIGLPYEDYARFAKSFDDVYSLGAHMVQVGFLKMLKGSGLAQTIEQHGYVVMEKAPYQVLATKYLTYEEIWRLHIFEDIVEQFYNSRRFKHTVAYLIKKCGSAFSFYMGLAEYYHAKNYHLAAHSPQSLYAILLSFVREKMTGEMLEARELLKLDALTLEKGRLRPSALDWNDAFYNREVSDFFNKNTAEKYIDGYKFNNWRDLKRRYHIEVFNIDVARLIGGGSVRTGRFPYIFFLENGDGENEYKAIKQADFWLEVE
jgi:radical SAM superfamily enzyme YgiQ (UPF0313 family)